MLEGTTKTVVTVLGVGAGGLILWKLWRAANPSGTTKAENEEKAANTAVIQENKKLLDKYVKLKKPTYPDAHYAGWKAVLYKAMDGIGTSVPVIKNVIGYMMSDTDVVKLIDTFGIMNRKTNNPFSSDAVPLSLPGWFAEELSPNEKHEVNKILSDKRIGYRF